MIDVSMGKDDSIKILDGQGQMPILFRRFLSPSLKHSAIKSDGVSVYTQKMARACDFSRGSNERYFQTASLLLLHRAEIGW
jgi:hypothetical protein